MSVLRNGDDAYAVTIRDTVDQESGRSTSFGALYTTLDRLVEKGFVSKRQGEATPERGGRAKTYFRIEGAGIQALQDAQAVRDRMMSGLSLGLQPLGGAL